MVGHQIVQVPSTKMSLAITEILKEEGYIEDFESYTENNRKYLLLSLKYMGKSRNPVISKIKRISKPGLRVYSNATQLPKVLDNLGIAIISTSKGVMTNLKAKELGIGGEVLCYIW
jgi:small subunit ribosomal protein S8